MRKPLIAFALFLAGTVISQGQDTTSVVWGNFSGNTATQNAILLLNGSGNSLSQGVPTQNTDGFLVQLGFFEGSTGANNFTGTWRPLTGAVFSQLPTQPARTSIGDSSNNTGAGNGVISFQTFFLSGENQPFVYDPAFAGAYQTQSSITITNTTPPSGQVLAIRFYDTTNGASGFYNTVSADNWTWQAPNTPGGGQVNIVMANNFTNPGGAVPPLEFESFPAFGAAGDFRTVILVPEPSTYALLMVGLMGAAFARRRFKSAA